MTSECCWCCGFVVAMSAPSPPRTDSLHTDYIEIIERKKKRAFFATAAISSLMLSFVTKKIYRWISDSRCRWRSTRCPDSQLEEPG